MSDDNEDRTDVTEAGTPTPDEVTNEPRGNPETDQEALDKGIEQLERVKPY